MTRRGNRMALLAAIEAELLSEDSEMRYRALHRVCPCSAGWGEFERLRPLLERLRKDPVDRVRCAALHVFQDALEMQSSGQPTTRQMVTNEMARTRIRRRWRADNAEPAHSRRAIHR